MSNVTLCKFLYASPPACTTTYADYLGSKFDTLQIILAIVYLVQVLITVYFAYRIYLIKGFSVFDTQVKMFCLQLLAYLVWIPRIVDACGFRAWIPYVVILLSYDWVTCAILSQIYLVVFDWVRVLMKVGGQQQYSHIVRYVFIGVIGLDWICATITSIGEGTADAMWKWHAAKLLIYAIVLIAIVVTQTVSGLNIFRILYKNEKRWKSKKPARSNTQAPRSSSAFDLEIGSSPRSTAAPTPTASAEALTNTTPTTNPVNTTNPATTNPTTEQTGPLSKRKSSQVYRILKLMALATILEIIVLYLMFSSVQGDFSDQWTRDVPRTPPASTGDMLFQAAYDIISFVCTCLTLIFFRPSLKASTRSLRAKETSSSTETGTTSNRVHASRRNKERAPSASIDHTTASAPTHTRQPSDAPLASMSEVDEKAEREAVDVAHVSPNGSRRSITVEPVPPST